MATKNADLARRILRKEVVSLGFYLNKVNDTLHSGCESVIEVKYFKKGNTVENNASFFGT
ncbi:MAG: hypothetical protein IKL47_11820 [Clostridia bacterium]|nr:hypothetical protein [Clostridia bacterium]